MERRCHIDIYRKFLGVLFGPGDFLESLDEKVDVSDDNIIKMGIEMLTTRADWARPILGGNTRCMRFAIWRAEYRGANLEASPMQEGRLVDVTYS